uniref:Uncharacterized protein n=1 Tax=Oryza sativa subsp. japonica TaxID=39947 RepID=Q69M88_ORYSJ|nr:hypothetical protein [Oryza sativa Japonica Group]BAD36352.1 hypothetical protein [Oryza sativa Japonica Group]BAD36425.1 hypothetical protein [Oryza sativa Japonica Group]BAD36426.1 hypothetical protein [Oryza sativa Japonica Group]
MEGTGESGGKRKKVEGSAGMVYMGSGGADEAGKVADLAGDVGEMEEERESGGNFKSPAVCGRASWREVRGRWAATWAWGTGGVGAGNGETGGVGGGFGGGGAVGWRRKKGPTGGPHLSVTRREEGGSGPAQLRGGRARGRRTDWADGPRREKKGGKRKRRKDFPGI